MVAIRTPSPTATSSVGSLAVGDFDGDGFDDLAVGAPWEDLVSRLTGNWILDAGAVQVLYGSASGLAADRQKWYQELPDVLGGSERSDLFGAALAVGDFDGDGFADLAVGVPWENLGAVVEAPVQPRCSTVRRAD